MPTPLSSLTKLVDELATALQKKRETEEEVVELAKKVLQDSIDANQEVSEPVDDASTEQAAIVAARAMDLKMTLQQLQYVQQETLDTIDSASAAIALVRKSVYASVAEWPNTVEAVGNDYRERITAEQEMYSAIKQEQRRLSGKLKVQFDLLQKSVSSI
ncbi:hypothetical protein B9G98_04126 [Wickerhamiella sorbophila]|uniref:Uncharacterized protein n=1 Tax=Wickerhamiella sorbophila TaxID=45607 RepID=A0A2T0FNE3_9ASCO|nr:hypothetical protein B9G98_04126 [Wickerhamiella sorbophila]PRT56506.1 hypothetical protein B9G98_04126 [Wickerhamiella sorbophila]